MGGVDDKAFRRQVRQFRPDQFPDFLLQRGGYVRHVQRQQCQFFRSLLQRHRHRFQPGMDAAGHPLVILAGQLNAAVGRRDVRFAPADQQFLHSFTRFPLAADSRIFSSRYCR